MSQRRAFAIGVPNPHQTLTATFRQCPAKPLILPGEPGGTRTHDHLIKSQVLYHLSYRLTGACVEVRPRRVNSVAADASLKDMARRAALDLVRPP